MIIKELQDSVSNIGSVKTVAGILLAGSILTILVYIVSNPIASIINRYSEELEKDELVRIIRPPLTFSAIATVIWTVTQTVEIPNTTSSITDSILLMIVVILWTRFLYFIGRELIKSVIPYRYDNDLVPIVLNIWTLVSIIIGILFVFKAWNVDITPILASAGVIGIVVGLAARETISNFFGSVALYADNTYQRGDYIKIDGAEAEGFVEKISIRSTQLKTVQNNTVTIPNSELHKSVIENRSEPTNSHRIEIEVGVSYDEKPDKVKKIIEDTVDSFLSSSDFGISESVSNYKVLTKSFDDSAIVYRIFVWIEYPYQEPIARDGIQRVIYERLKKEDMTIPYPQRTIHMEDSEDITVNNSMTQNHTGVDSQEDEE